MCPCVPALCASLEGNGSGNASQPKMDFKEQNCSETAVPGPAGVSLGTIYGDKSARTGQQTVTRTSFVASPSTLVPPVV